MKKKDSQLTYREAIAELESIVNQIEGDEIDVDLLAMKVKRASFLIKFCKAKLKNTEGEVKKLLTDLEEDVENNSSKSS